jgi:hypothetical protein
MAYDRYTQEHHLTRSGWIVGTINGELKPRPTDAVETWVKKAEQSSGYSEEESDWHQVWALEACSPEELSVLRAKFPHPSIADNERNSRLRKVNSELRNWKRKKRARTI